MTNRSTAYRGLTEQARRHLYYEIPLDQADQIFDDYGLFYVTRVTYGGLLVMTATMETSSTLEKDVLQAKLQGGFTTLLGGASVSGHMHKGTVKISDKEELTMAIEVYGGDATVALNRPDDWESAVGAWTSTVDDENGQPIKVELRPIYELVRKSDRQKGLRRAWEDYIREKYPSQIATFLAWKNGANILLTTELERLRSLRKKMETAKSLLDAGRPRGWSRFFTSQKLLKPHDVVSKAVVEEYGILCCVMNRCDDDEIEEKELAKLARVRWQFHRDCRSHPDFMGVSSSSASSVCCGPDKHVMY